MKSDMTFGIPAIALAALLAACGNSPAMERKPYVESEKVAPSSSPKPCSQQLHLLRRLHLVAGDPAAEALEEFFDAERLVGVEENVTIQAEGRGAFLRVRYPENSINFGSADDEHPLGGAQFYVPVSRGEVSCLHYRVRFPAGFDFVKGGKLPGLFAGEAPSGGDKVTGRDGWTVRLMWREEGRGELYEYVYNMKGKYGASIGRGSFSFPHGRWVEVDLEVRENDPGRRNGAARLWIDGRLVIEQNDIVYRTEEDGASEWGLLFSTFFGGNDSNWATPRDQHVDFTDLHLFGGDGG